MGSGLRLLSLIGGLVLGAVSAARIARLVGAKVTVALGFAILATGLLIGTATSVSSSGTFIATWMAIVGVGMGLAMATSTSAALSELSEEQSGVGSAVLQAVNKVPLGTAILGSVLSAAYLTALDVSGLPASAASAARESIFGAVAVAHELHSTRAACFGPHGVRARNGPRSPRRRLHRGSRRRARRSLPATNERLIEYPASGDQTAG